METPLLWNRNSVPVFPCPELPFPFRSFFLGLENQLPGRHLFPCAFSSRTVFLFVLPIQKKQENVIETKGSAQKEEGYFIKEKDGYIIVYLSDEKTVYEYTTIEIQYLPERIQEEVKKGKKADTIGEVYGFLENYSS